MRGSCAKCGRLCEFSVKPGWEKWVYCPKCRLYTVPKLHSVK
jgi:hypothetical protein